jgi:competence protein ComEC
MFGERNGIPQQDWQVLRSTGTNHLMAIAGLHIGMIAGLIHSLVTWLWRRSEMFTLHMPAMIAGAYASLAVAIFYAALAGFSLPAQRACIMLSVYTLTLINRHKINPWHSWASALLFVLLLNPADVLTESFWLSFSTIALIIFGMSGRLAPAGLWWKWGRVQWVVGIGLVPLSLFLFQQTSFISFVANSISIPWLGLFILPVCLSGGVFTLIAPRLGELLLTLADKSLGLLWKILAWLAQLNMASWHHAMPGELVLFATVIGVVFLLVPGGFPGRWLGLVWLLPLFLIKPARPQPGDFFLTLLDAGQGLSAVVQTDKHILVFDAGPRFADSMDAGADIVLPYLRIINAKQIDMIVISHGDNDHIGGAPALMKNLPILSINTSVPEKLPSPVTHYCFAGSSWRWDGVNFTFLYPTKENLHLSNDSSCVLRIDNGVQSILLTGDIEKYAETDLLARTPAQLSARILIAPHHGSKTSGLPAFVAAVHPDYVLYATGYRNRYHFPHASVVAAYSNIRAHELNTALTGTITFKLNKHSEIQQPERYRDAYRKYWMDT